MPPFLFVRYHGQVNALFDQYARLVLFLGGNMATEPSDARSNRSQDPYQLDRRLTILETRFDTILPTLATKADLAELRAELRSTFKSDLHTEINALTRWLIALTISMLFGFGGIIVALLRH